MPGSANGPFDPEAFTRLDEADDARFYAEDRFVDHLDATALGTVERLIGTLAVEEAPAVLDLMAGWKSHLPDQMKPAETVGLGLNPRELERNSVLDRRVLHDLNRDPTLPFGDASFDLVFCTVSVDYLTRPVEVFRDTARVIKPGGLFLVVFSNRMFPEKAVKIWRESDEQERLELVERYFGMAGGFDPCRTFVSKGLPRPERDKYYPLGLPSDPVYAAYAERSGGDPARAPRPEPASEPVPMPPPEVISARKSRAAGTLLCPYCAVRMKKWAVPQSPFTEWDVPFMFLCFNDACPYLVRGWRAMERQGNRGVSYRAMYNPWRDYFTPIPVPNLMALREGIIEIEASTQAG